MLKLHKLSESRFKSGSIMELHELAHSDGGNRSVTMR